MSLSILVLAAMGLGCGDDHHNMMSNNSGTGGAILRVYPADGATNVPMSAAIAVKFNRKMDTISVMNNLRLMGGGEMHEWMDTAAHHGGMGHMSMRDMDHMMNWMDSIAMGGAFSWNQAIDSCEFVPTAGMLANQEHMIFMYEGGMMDHNGGMMGSNHTDDQYHSYHFMTGQ